MSQGRYVRIGLTWKSAMVTLVVILAALVALGVLLERAQSPFQLDATVLDHRVVETDAGCAWEIEIEAHNMSQRQLSLVSARLDGVDGSDWAIIGVVAPAESIVRAYRYALPDCSTDPGTLGVNALVLEYKPRASSLERSVTVDID